MKNIAVLVDYTDTCYKSVEFAGKIAKKCDSKVILIHIANRSEKKDETNLLAKMEVYCKSLSDQTPFELHIEYGSFYSLIPNTVINVEADMLVVGTHGIVGIKQTLLGSNILKLTNSLPIPSLVVQNESVYSENTFGKLLFPIGPHDNYEMKLNQVAKIAIPFKSTVYGYCIQKELESLPEVVLTNIQKSKLFFEENKINFEMTKENPEGFSVGHSKQLLAFANEQNMGAICMISKISTASHAISKVDKENTLLNNSGIPVYCSN